MSGLFYRIVPAPQGALAGAKVFDHNGREVTNVRSITWQHVAGDLPTIVIEVYAEQAGELGANRERVTVTEVRNDEDDGSNR